MPRLIASLAAAAAVLADQAADRLDTWVENTTTADAPRETPLGFAVPNGLEMPDEEAVIKAAAARVAGEQRDRWLAAVKGRLDASTGGPWVTDRGSLDVITSPYGVIATGVIRDGDRALIEDARADLYGLLALAEEDARLIAAWEGAAKSHESRRAETERELAGMHEREAAVDRVLDSLVDGRLKLAEYVDPETPAGRVAELVTTLLTQIRDAENGAQVQHLTDALQVANSNNAAMKQELDRARLMLEHAEKDGTTADVEVSGVMGAYDRDPTLTAVQVREGSLAERVLKALRSERVERIQLERRLDAHHRHDEAELTTADAVRAAAAARIREAIELCEDESRSMFTEHEVDAEGYLAGLRDAVKLVIDETPEADPNVAPIDTVNSLAAEYTPGPVAEAILASGGTIVVNDNGDPQVADVPLIATGPGTLITSDGKRHRFTNSTASPVDDYVAAATDDTEESESGE